MTKNKFKLLLIFILLLILAAFYSMEPELANNMLMFSGVILTFLYKIITHDTKSFIFFSLFMIGMVLAAIYNRKYN